MFSLRCKRVKSRYILASVPSTPVMETRDATHNETTTGVVYEASRLDTADPIRQTTDRPKKTKFHAMMDPNLLKNMAISLSAWLNI